MNLDRRPDNHEAAMARADLYKLANYSMKLFKMIQEGQELEGWVQAKITKAADYVASVYHFMEYEMKSSEYGEKLENSDVYSESVRRAFEQKLMEAKKQAAKVKEKAEKMDEGFDDMEKYLKDKKGPQPSGGAGKKAGSKYGGSKQADDKDDDDDKLKSSSNTYKVSRAVLAKESSKPDYLDFDKDGNKKEPMKKALKDKKKVKENSETFESGLQYHTGVKKHGKKYMDMAAELGRKGASQEELGRLKDKHSKAYKDKKVKEGGEKLPSPPDEVHLPKKDSKHGPVDVYRKKANDSVKEGAGCNQTMEGKSCPVHGLKECPMEEAAKKGLYYNVNKRKKAGTSRDKDHPKAPSAQDWKNAAKTAKK